MEKLTTKQELVLQIIKKWIAQYGSLQQLEKLVNKPI